VPAVFISYSRRDKGFVERLHDALAAREYDVWVDWEDIPPSAEWFEEIRAGVRNADGFIYVISPDSVASEVCTRELGNAVDQNKRIVPVVCREPDGAAVPEQAAALNWVFLRVDDDFDAGVEQLVSALETDLEHVRTHTRLGVAAARWESSDHDRSLLLRGSDLTAAEAWLVAGAGKQPEATQLQRQFVLSSRQAASRRQRATIGAVSVALAVAIVLAVVALVQRSTAIHERNVAYARQLDANAQAKYPSDPELSVLLAVKAAQVAPGSATQEALREALAQSNVRVRYTLTYSSNAAVAGDALWSPNGTRLLVTSPGAGGWARIYRPGTNSAPVTLTGGPPLSSAGESAWNATGSRVVLGGGAPAVYDATTGALIRRLPGSALHSGLTPDGSRAVTVDVHSIGHVFDVATGRQVVSFTPRYRGGTTCGALSPDGTVFAQCDTQSLDTNGAVALDTWDIRSGRLLHSVSAPSLIGSVAFRPDGRQYVFTVAEPSRLAQGASLAAEVRAEAAPGTFVYDTDSGRLVIDFAGAASVASFGPSSQFPVLAYATLGNDLGNLYDFTRRSDQPLIGSSDVINSLRFSQSGAYVVAGGRDRTARVYDTGTGGLPLEVLAGHQAQIIDASFGLDDTLIATTSSDATTRLWTSPKPRPAAILPPPASAPHRDAEAASIAFTADGRKIVETTGTGVGRVLAAGDLHVFAQFAAPAGDGFAGAGVSRDGRVVVALSGPSNKLGSAVAALTAAELYDAGTGRLLKTLTPTTPGPLVNASLDYNGGRLVTIGVGGGADEWDTRTGQLLHHLPGSGVAVAAAFSKDGSRLAIAHYPADLPKLVTPSTSFPNVTVDLFDAGTGRLQRLIAGQPLQPQEDLTKLYSPLALAFSPDGNLLAVSGADQSVDVYNAHTGRPLEGLGLSGAPGGSFAVSLAFSPDGKLLAAGAASGTYVWRVPSFVHLPTFLQVPAGSTSPYVGSGFGVYVGFTADSNYLVTTGDLALEAWDLADQLQTFKTPARSPVARGSMSPDGTRLVTASAAGVAVYPCELCGGLPQLLAVARRHTTRSLTRGERAKYLTQG
jgi:WD40 repeat protein